MCRHYAELVRKYEKSRSRNTNVRQGGYLDVLFQFLMALPLTEKDFGVRSPASRAPGRRRVMQNLNITGAATVRFQGDPEVTSL